MSVRADLATDLAAGLVDYEQSFEWQGLAYPCVRKDGPESFELQPSGGDVDRAESRIVVSKASFNAGAGPFPQEGDLIDNSSRQIKTIDGEKDAGAVQLVIVTGSPDA